jgi:hypothetical protein
MANSDPLKIGESNTGTSKTSLTSIVQDPVLFVENTSSSGTNAAIEAKMVNPGAGGTGLAATGNVAGVSAVAIHNHGVGVRGEALATSGTATGVVGIAESASIYSQEPAVISGVHGFANAGTGVRGDSISGFGVVAASGSGTALKVDGKASFSTSGEGSIHSRKSSVTVANTHVTSKSHITVTLTDNPGNHATVVWVSRTPGVGFKVHLNMKVVKMTSFTYLIIEPT